ncbi:aminomethyltransferase family protein [Alphaproteobacteria bacterium]|nr:aminomethyltransferase family protein [Alphaproteobacteria bacterium]
MGNLQEESDLKSTITISARRFEESPFIERTNTPNMIRGVYAGRYFPMQIDEDPIEKYWLLRQKAVIFDVPEKPIEISGPDASSFLNKVLTRDITNVQEGRGYYALACTPQGGIFMDGVIFKFNDNKYWYVQADGPFEDWLIAHSSNYNIKITDPKSRVLQIQGPASLEIMKKASRGIIDENMKYFRSGFFDIGGQKLYVSRTGFTNELGFEIFSDGLKTDHLALWDYLMECGKPFGMEFSASRAMTIRRIEGGIFGNLTDIDTSMTPFEAGLGLFVNMDKRDFIGKDSLKEKDKRTCLFGLTCEKAVPAAGSKVILKNKIVGYVTAGVPSPTLQIGIGYVRFYEPDSWIGQDLLLELPDGGSYEAKVVNLPFIDLEKKIVRGLDRSIPSKKEEVLFNGK